jgi:predicted AlkP superfamily pyrophosphatase or phosphodiesterase
MDRLIAEGAHTLQARTVMPSVTLPCHTSLFLGVEPDRHGITTNTWTPQVRPVPGIVEALKGAGKRSAFFHNWDPLRDLSRPETLYASFFLDNYGEEGGAGDRELAEIAAVWLGSHEVQFAFVYLGHTDEVGHNHGWMSGPYLNAIANADRCIERVCAALRDEALVIVTSDHGGHAKTHGTPCEEDMTTPVLLKGPGIPAGQVIDRPVRITDIAPTVVHYLGVEPPKEWIGDALRF